MTEPTETDRLRELQEGPIGQFLDWLAEQGLAVAERTSYGMWAPTESKTGLLSRYGTVDLRKVAHEALVAQNSVERRDGAA